MKSFQLLFILSMILLASCTEKKDEPKQTPFTSNLSKERAAIYTPVKLTTDLSALSDESKKMIPLLIEAGKIMDTLFWLQSFGHPDSLLPRISDVDVRTFAKVNYGPWDRLDGDSVFINEFGPKPLGAQFYPEDMTKEQFDNLRNSHKTSLYTILERDETGKLKHVYYHTYYAPYVKRAAALLRKAGEISTNQSLKYYLDLRAKALETDVYSPSDIAWLNLENNEIDVIIGPIENYEDKLYGYKAAYECYVLVKDKEWSERLDRYKALLPGLQKELPCEDKYKQDEIGSNAQLNAYDVIFYAGDCNAGSKTIAVNLPNSETIQQEHGTRRSQLKNAMQAKFDKILVPISNSLIEEDQRKHITFNAFFSNTMFHEVAHGLGIKNTINGQGTVRETLKEQASALEEGKADILGLWMVTRLYEMGEMPEGELMDNYVTFLAGIFRSVRFGASSAHGKANMLRFNYFNEMGAFTKDPTTGMYRVEFEAMQTATESLSALILKLQGEGDYEGVKSLMEEKATIGAELQSELDALSDAGIPVDVVFEQGVKELGL
jgi:hypothetical protein